MGGGAAAAIAQCRVREALRHFAALQRPSGNFLFLFFRYFRLGYGISESRKCQRERERESGRCRLRFFAFPTRLEPSNPVRRNQLSSSRLNPILAPLRLRLLPSSHLSSASLRFEERHNEAAQEVAVPPRASPPSCSRCIAICIRTRRYCPPTPSSRAHRHTALSLVQLWINRSACPFALETTALLVQSVILDEHMQQIAAQSHAPPATSSLHYALEQMGGGAELGVRLNYSLALMRFVNSVVDSHQTGGFAQSIAAIAARIGLPQWFVEIRHATTHEELPSISVCRHAARAALAWLHTHFWAPQLFDTRHEPRAARADPSGSRQPADVEFGVSTEPTSSSQEEEKRRSERTKALRELRVTLKDYRELAKKVARDRSLANAAKADMRRLFKQLAMFVSRIRTLEPEFGAQLIERARATKGKDEEADVRQGAQDPDDVDECTKSALADLVNQLLQPGGLVPRSRSKRVSASASGKGHGAAGRGGGSVGAVARVYARDVRPYLWTDPRRGAGGRSLSPPRPPR
ncbi:hypothetical protein L1887_53799 [Cichorium endivia]|nr:hypothetical protein L1887_53799 [Cichorium endivia]